jgi:hypothetical protein
MDNHYLIVRVRYSHIKYGYGVTSHLTRGLQNRYYKVYMTTGYLDAGDISHKRSMYDQLAIGRGDMKSAWQYIRSTGWFGAVT